MTQYLVKHTHSHSYHGGINPCIYSAPCVEFFFGEREKSIRRSRQKLLRILIHKAPHFSLILDIAVTRLHYDESIRGTTATKCE
jgi:hypothetical protein